MQIARSKKTMILIIKVISIPDHPIIPIKIIIAKVRSTVGQIKAETERKPAKSTSQMINTDRAKYIPNSSRITV